MDDANFKCSYDTYWSVAELITALCFGIMTTDVGQFS